MFKIKYKSQKFNSTRCLVRDLSFILVADKYLKVKMKQTGVHLNRSNSLSENCMFDLTCHEMSFLIPCTFHCIPMYFHGFAFYFVTTPLILWGSYMACIMHSELSNLVQFPSFFQYSPFAQLTW